MLSHVACVAMLAVLAVLAAPNASAAKCGRKDFGFKAFPFFPAPPCHALTDIIAATPDPEMFVELGNFTVAPTPELLKGCSATNSASLLGGNALAAALKQPEPMVKLLKVLPLGPIVWPAGTTFPRAPSGSVNVIDCQGEFLDLREWPTTGPMEEAAYVFIRCGVLFPDLNRTLTTLEWNIDSSISFPCDGESRASMAQAGLNLSRDAPLVFEELPEVLREGSRSYSFNVSAWCYTAEDIDDVYCGN